MAKQVNVEELIEFYNKKHNNFYDYSKFVYTRAKDNSIIICPIHGEFPQSADNHKRSGCSKCGEIKIQDAKIKGVEYHIGNILKHHGDKYILPNLEGILYEDEINVTCKKHGEFKTRISYLTRGSGCSKCGSETTGLKRRNKIEDVKESFIKIHGNKYGYDRFTEYEGIDKTIDIFCKKHKEYFPQIIQVHKMGCGCPKCGMEKSNSCKNDTQEAFLEKAFAKGGVDNISFEKLNYQGSSKNITLTCKTHGDFEVSPGNFLHKGYRCRKCNNQTSKAEKEIAEFIKEYVDIVESDRSVLGRHELDILIPTSSIAIEFNGLYWHSDKFVDKNYHLDKTKNCLAKEIKLIHIFEDEWRDKKEIVKSRLLNIIGKTESKIFARQCEVRELESKTVSKFLDENHIQGKVGGKVRLGLYYKEELVSLMTFGNLRKALGSKGTEQDFELLRFCNKLNTTVVGGASKLLKYFENNFDYKTITSYADRRWSEGNLYFNLGFELVSETKPNYFYTKGEFRENRFKYRKSELKAYNKENRTEKQLMEELGYSRIYDSGTLKFKKEKPNV
jgi:hypothetical protein